MGKIEAIKKVAVALGYGTNVNQYTGKTVAKILKEVAVKMNITSSTENIRANSTTEVLNFIAANYGSESVNPFDLVITDTHSTVTVMRNGAAVQEGTDVLYAGDELTITAEGATGYDLTTLTVNGTSKTSGSKVTVNGSVTIVATGTLKTFDLERTATDCTISVTKGGNAVTDGENKLSYGDVITITATTEEGYEMKSLKVNGETFTSGQTLTVTEDVTIVGVAEATE